MFTLENTSGFTAAQLVALNHARETAIRELDSDSPNYADMVKHEEDRILAAGVYPQRLTDGARRAFGRWVRENSGGLIPAACLQEFETHLEQFQFSYEIGPHHSLSGAPVTWSAREHEIVWDAYA